MENNVLDIIAPLSKARRDSLVEAARNLPSELVTISCSLQASETVWTNIYTHDAVKKKGDIAYADQELQRKADVLIMKEQKNILEKLDASDKTTLFNKLANMLNPEVCQAYDNMLSECRSYSVARKAPFKFPPSLDSAQLTSDHVWQEKDITGIIDIKKKVKNDDGSVSYLLSLNTMRNINNIINSIKEKWPDELKPLRFMGPRLDGAAGWFYHDDIFKLIARYKEEESLRRLLTPPHGEPTPDDSALIIEFWNKFKRVMYTALISNKYLQTIQQHLDNMGYPGNDVYLEDMKIKWRNGREASDEHTNEEPAV